MNATRIIVSFLFAVLCWSGMALAASPPDLINYQGVLRDSSDDPEDGSFDMIFRFFDASAGGNEILIDEHLAAMTGDVTVTGGLFNVQLGSGDVMDGAGAFANDPYDGLNKVFRDFNEVWMQIEIDPPPAGGGFEVLSPRVRVLSAAYALNADHLDGMDSAAFITSETDPQVGSISTNRVPKWTGTALENGTINDVSGNVGIGTTSPNEQLEITGNFRLPASTATTGIIMSGGDPFIHNRGTNNFFAGVNAGNLTMTGFGGNTATGVSALISNTTGPFNTANGYFALADNTTGADNTANGYFALRSNTTGRGNTAIGAGADVSAGNLTNATAIGYGARVAASDSLVLGSNVWVGIGTNSPNAFLDIAASGHNVALLRLSTERPWEFRQEGTGSNTSLKLVSTVFGTTKHFIIQTSGNVGIGTTSPTAKLHVIGSVSKSSGSFQIDHPLDPANKYLYHSFVESPDMMNVYNGNVTTDETGHAVISFPEWFEVLNKDFRYQLTVIGEYSQTMVEEEIQDKQFTIRTDRPNVRVSWQVTGIRQDPWAEQHRIQVEQDKPQRERGTYLHPEVHGMPRELGIAYLGQSALDQETAGPREVAEKPVVSDSESDSTTGQTESVISALGKASTSLPMDDEGNVYANSFRPASAELATSVPVSEPVGLGDVLVADPDNAGLMLPGRIEADPAVVGIVSGEPGVLLGGGRNEVRPRGDLNRDPEMVEDIEDEMAVATTRAPVAFSGIVPCKVDAGYGAIRVGDLLTTSSTRGHAMRTSDPQPGTILGKALEPLDAGTGLIKVLVMLR